MDAWNGWIDEWIDVHDVCAFSRQYIHIHINNMMMYLILSLSLFYSPGVGGLVEEAALPLQSHDLMSRQHPHGLVHVGCGDALVAGDLQVGVTRRQEADGAEEGDLLEELLMLHLPLVHGLLVQMEGPQVATVSLEARVVLRQGGRPEDALQLPQRVQVVGEVSQLYDHVLLEIDSHVVAPPHPLHVPPGLSAELVLDGGVVSTVLQIQGPLSPTITMNPSV